MFALLIIPILVSGFILCNHHPYYHHKLHRFKGQYLYLKSTLLGFACLLLALISIYMFWYQPWINYFFNHYGFINQNKPNEIFWLIYLSFSMILCAWMWVALVVFWITIRGRNNREMALMSSILKDSPLDRLFFDSYTNIRPLMLSLNDRKVYVGIVASLGEPNEVAGLDQEISIIPLMSGYRHPNSLQVEFVTDYKNIHESINVIIRQNIICYATPFNFEAYEHFIFQPSSLND